MSSLQRATAVESNNPFMQLHVASGPSSVTSETESVLSTPPNKRAKVAAVDETQMIKKLQALDDELNKKKLSLEQKRNKAQTAAQDKHAKTVKTTETKFKTAVASADTQNDKRLKPILKALATQQAETDALKAQLEELQAQYEKAELALNEQHARVGTSNGTRDAAVEVARSARAAAVESSEKLKNSVLESAAEAHAKDLATAVTANEVKRDKLLNSLSHVDRSKILAEEQEREANMAHYNNDIDPEAALALALQASVAQTQEEEARPGLSTEAC